MRVRTFEVVCLAVALAPVGSVSFAQGADRCYGFLLRADVFATCEGSTTQVTHRGDLESFAVKEGEPILVYTTSRVLKRSATAAWAESTATVIGLESGSVKRVDGILGVGSACGGVFTVNAPGPAPRVLDPVDNTELRFPPYSRFRCSSDRKTVVGITEFPGGGLYLGVPPATKIAEREAVDPTRFNISPDGSKIAYFNSPYFPLCVTALTGTRECVSYGSAMPDPPSVSNSGEVLVTVGTGQGCSYKGPYYFAPAPFPGASSGDECLGIGYWRPGLKTIKLIEPLGRNPQWISPATAKLLRVWAAKQEVPRGK